jgi:hypothetical protein
MNDAPRIVLRRFEKHLYIGPSLLTYESEGSVFYATTPGFNLISALDNYDPSFDDGTEIILDTKVVAVYAGGHPVAP